MTPNTETTEKSVLKDATVLVVEDNVSNFVLIARMLGYLGIHCEWKTSGYEVVEYADTLPRLDLVLMDIRMPVMGGYEATSKIRQFNKDIIILAQTAYAQSGDREKAIEAGCNDYISKPIDTNLLYKLIKKHINK